jgi:ParB-like chromosome segregation protein Spo0J
MAYESRIVGHGEVAPAELVANPSNWRTHPKAQQDALAGVLSEVGWVQDVIVNKRSGYLVDGHARVAVAAKRGEASVPVVYVDLSEEEEQKMLATLDPLAAMAGADTAALADLLTSVTSEDAALAEMLADLGDQEIVMAFQTTDAAYIENPIAERNEAVLGADPDAGSVERGLKPFMIYVEAAHVVRFKEQMAALGSLWDMTNPSDVVIRAIELASQEA